MGRTHSPIVHNLTVLLLSSLLDGLEILDPLQSCNRRVSRHQDAFVRLTTRESDVLVRASDRGGRALTCVGEERETGREFL